MIAITIAYQQDIFNLSILIRRGSYIVDIFCENVTPRTDVHGRDILQILTKTPHREDTGSNEVPLFEAY